MGESIESLPKVSRTEEICIFSFVNVRHLASTGSQGCSKRSKATSRFCSSVPNQKIEVGQCERLSHERISDRDTRAFGGVKV